MANPNEIVLRVAPQFKEALVQYAVDSGLNSAERAALILLENALRADPRTPQALALLKAAVREGVLQGYALAKGELDTGLARALSRVDILAREIYRTKYKSGDLSDGDRDTFTVQDMERRGDFRQIDEQRSKTERKDRPRQVKETPLTPAQKDARDFLGAGADSTAADLTRVIEDLQPVDGEP